MNKRLLAAVALLAPALAVGLIGLATSAYADPITPSPTIVSGNLTFSNFTCSVSPGASVGCAQIGVFAHTSTTPPDPTSGDFGIRIQGSFNSGTTSEDIAIEYDATIAGGLFHDASMFFNGTATSSVSETIFAGGTSTVIGQLQVNNPPPNFTDDIVLSENVTSIHVVKDIGLNFTTANPATISIVDQQFSQVPEPASLALLGTGLLGLGLIRRWRRRV